jgi:type IV pilus assembly protein PilQ
MKLSQYRQGIALVCLVMSVALVSACATNMASKQQAKTDEVMASDGTNVIKDISVVENADSIDIMIKGAGSMNYTTVDPPLHPGVVLYLPDTALGEFQNTLTLENGLISSISASQTTESGITSRIEIALKKEASYEIELQGSDMKVSFPKTFQPSEKEITTADSAVKPSDILEASIENEDGSFDKTPESATQLQAVATRQKGRGVLIMVEGNGEIIDFDSFSVKSTDRKPARIIFDLFNITSAYEQEQVLAINTPYVKKVKHLGYSDRVRLVVETSNEYLAACEAQTVKNGLEIRVGNVSAEMVQQETMRHELSYVDAEDPASPIIETDISDSMESAALPNLEDYSHVTSAAAQDFSTSAMSPLEDPTHVQMRAVEVMSLNKGVILKIDADAAIDKFRSFTIRETPDYPARIVFDIPKLKSFSHREEIIPVDSEYAVRVRHRGYPERVRLVIDTDERYLGEYSTRKLADGLEITIGEPKRIAEVSAESDGNAAPVSMQQPDQEPEILPVIASMQVHDETQSGGMSWVKKIEFYQAAAGKSTVSINMTQPVKYEIKEVGPKKLNLVMYDVRIPSERKRPLITTRFDSAVDRIIPVQKPSMKKNALVVVELREMVPYTVDQQGSMLRIDFEASSVPPKPAEQARLPEWKRVVAESEIFEKSVETPSTEKISVSEGVEEEIREEIQGMPSTAVPYYRKKYSGEKIALDFYETDIKNVFRILREVSGKNFAIDKDVTGKVTMTLDKPVPWDQVLDLVLRMNQLDRVYEGDIIRIAKISTLTKEERDRQANIAAVKQAKEQAKELEPLKTEYIPISYSNAKKEILPHLELIYTKERGSLSVDERTNMVIMTDTDEKIRQAKQIVRRLDKVTPQVIIEARIVEAITEFARELGIKWNFEYGISNDDERAGLGPQRGYDTLGGTWGWSGAVDLPLPNNGILGFEFTRINGTPLTIDARLGAMEMSGEGKIISAPKIMTLDNKKATIKQGREVPYEAIDDDGRSNVQFKDVDLLLEVTPHVTPDDRISLRVFITNNEIIGVEPGSGVPIIGTKEAETELLIDDGETIVIGGILQKAETRGEDGIPFLNKLPVLSWVFNAKANETRKEELLIFLTPRIIQLEQRMASDI